MLCSVTVESKDDCFKKLIDFIGKRNLGGDGALLAETEKNDDTVRWWQRKLKKKEKARMSYRPATNSGIQTFKYAHAYCLLVCVVLFIM
jgi:hypothetical protein